MSSAHGRKCLKRFSKNETNCVAGAIDAPSNFLLFRNFVFQGNGRYWPTGIDFFTNAMAHQTDQPTMIYFYRNTRTYQTDRPTGIAFYRNTMTYQTDRHTGIDFHRNTMTYQTDRHTGIDFSTNAMTHPESHEIFDKLFKQELRKLLKILAFKTKLFTFFPSLLPKRNREKEGGRKTEKEREIEREREKAREIERKRECAIVWWTQSAYCCLDSIRDGREEA